MTDEYIRIEGKLQKLTRTELYALAKKEGINPRKDLNKQKLVTLILKAKGVL